MLFTHSGKQFGKTTAFVNAIATRGGDEPHLPVVLAPWFRAELWRIVLGGGINGWNPLSRAAAAELLMRAGDIP